MAGLFTLDSEILGVLDADVLGGQGTGFIVGLTSSTGAAAGVQGFDGSASGEHLSVGSASGYPSLVGLVTGTETSNGSVEGLPQFVGLVIANSDSTGSVVGSSARFGLVIGTTSSTGTTQGQASLTGLIAGESRSAGSVTGTTNDVEQPLPPAPTPAPTPKRGGRRVYVQPQQTKPTLAAGSVSGASRSQGRTQGRCAHIGVAMGVTRSAGVCRGTSRLSVSPIRLHIDHDALRRKAEDELLLLEFT